MAELASLNRASYVHRVAQKLLTLVSFVGNYWEIKEICTENLGNVGKLRDFRWEAETLCADMQGGIGPSVRPIDLL